MRNVPFSLRWFGVLCCGGFALALLDEGHLVRLTKAPRVDSATYGSAVDAVKAVDVTDKVNGLLERNSVTNFTAGGSFEDVFGDPAYGDVKVLRVSAGGRSLNFLEGSTSNRLGSLASSHDLSAILSTEEELRAASGIAKAAFVEEAWGAKEAGAAAQGAATSPADASGDGGRLQTRFSELSSFGRGSGQAAATARGQTRRQRRLGRRHDAFEDGPVVMGYQDLSAFSAVPFSDVLQRVGLPVDSDLLARAASDASEQEEARHTDALSQTVLDGLVRTVGWALQKSGISNTTVDSQLQKDVDELSMRGWSTVATTPGTIIEEPTEEPIEEPTEEPTVLGDGQPTEEQEQQQDTVAEPQETQNAAAASVTEAQNEDTSAANSTPGHMCESKLRTPVALTADEFTFAQCPPGNYLEADSEEVREARRARLLKAMCAAKTRGWRGSNWRETDSFRQRGYATFESKVWPKPAKCTKLPHEAWSAVHVRGHSFYRPDAPPKWMAKWVNKKAQIEFHQNWKVASTSWPTYLRCAFDGDWEQVPASEYIKSGTVVASAVRDPVGRFVSAASELLERALNHWCPGGPCGPADSFDRGVTVGRMRKQTSWLDIALGNKPNATGDYMMRLMKALVSDTSCNFYTYACEHLNTQALFVTQNEGAANHIDVIVKLEELDEGLHKLSAAANTKHKNHCKLARTNVKTGKPANARVPSSEDMLQVLNQNKNLMQKLCLIYAQDFVCFDYKLPEACEGLF